MNTLEDRLKLLLQEWLNTSKEYVEKAEKSYRDNNIVTEVLYHSYTVIYNTCAAQLRAELEKKD